jgi:hypothetical protein
MRADRPRESAFLVTEELGFDELPGMAPQFTATNAKFERSLRCWIVSATTSLPLPDSPVMKPVATVGATLPIRR